MMLSAIAGFSVGLAAGLLVAWLITPPDPDDDWPY